MKLEWHTWHTSTQGNVSKLYVDAVIAAFVYQSRVGTYVVHMYTGSTRMIVGVFPTHEEAQQCAELLAPIYANFTK